MSARPDRVSVFAGIGARLSQFDVDLDSLTLGPERQVARLPANVQYACATASGRCLYVVSSNGGPGTAGTIHHLSAFRIDWDAGRLQPHGTAVPLRQRPIHITVDRDSSHALIAYNNPSAISVHALAADGVIEGEVAQGSDLDAGVFAHQIYVAQSNRAAILVTRGNDAGTTTPEDPGALKVLDYDRGRLTNRASVAPRGGYGFGPRNVEFSPSQAWLYVSLERQNRLDVFAADGEEIAPEPVFACDTLSNPQHIHPVQMAGAVHVHPGGRFVYIANRAFGTVDDGPARIFRGGENTIAVFDVGDAGGPPRRIQAADTGGIYPRTFSIDPTGTMMVVANSTPLLVRDGRGVSMMRANLSVFAIGDDGTLRHVRRYDIVDTRDKLFWAGLVPAW